MRHKALPWDTKVNRKKWEAEDAHLWVGSPVSGSDSPYTVTLEPFLLCNTDGGAITINLPPAATSSGQPCSIKNIGTSGNDVTVDAHSSETIDDNATQSVSDYECLSIVCDGTKWWVI